MRVAPIDLWEMRNAIIGRQARAYVKMTLRSCRKQSEGATVEQERINCYLKEPPTSRKVLDPSVPKKNEDVRYS